MPFQIVRNDITKMNTDAVVNTANRNPIVGPGCDYAIYQGAGFHELLAVREQIGAVEPGEVFLTPGFALPAKCIIHAVSPLYLGQSEKEEAQLRSCYRKSLELARKQRLKSIAFPLISTGSFHCPKEEGLRIAIDEINRFLMKHEMMVYLVVFDETSAALGSRLVPDLEEYISRTYVEEKQQEEYFDFPSAKKQSFLSGVWPGRRKTGDAKRPEALKDCREPIGMRPEAEAEEIREDGGNDLCESSSPVDFMQTEVPLSESQSLLSLSQKVSNNQIDAQENACFDLEEVFLGESMAPCPMPAEAPDCAVQEEVLFGAHDQTALNERMKHLSDTFQQYLFYLIERNGMTNAEVHKRAIVDKKVFSKIKNNPNYHPKKLTALCLCVGAKLNLDETKDLLGRAGYALSPCDKVDVIFAYFIEKQIYDMIEIDIQLEEHGLPCIIE